MRNIPASDIADSVSSAKKRSLMNTSIVNPARLVNAVGNDSWTIDGREDLPVSPRLVISVLRSHSTNNATDVSSGEIAAAESDASFANSQGEPVKGNPIIFGNLSTKNVTIMGTDDEPLLVMSASGRQMAKNGEWLTRFLGDCRTTLQTTKGDVTKAQGRIMSSCEDGSIAEKVVGAFAETDWLLIFKGGSAIGKPLATTDYSAQCWLKVGYGQGKPTTRRALEDSKRDNIRVPSTFTGEALSLQKLVHSYIFDDGFSEEGALRHARSLVANPIAVGANADPSEAYVGQLYRFSYLCDEARAIVDSELDPIKALSKLAKITKKCFKPTKYSVERADGSVASWTVNKLTEEQQIALLQPKAKAQKAATAAAEPEEPAVAPSKKSPKLVADSKFISVAHYPEVARRLTLMVKEVELPDADGDAAAYYEAKNQQRELAAVADFIRYQVHGAKALKDRPWLATALAALESDDDSYLELQDLLQDWNGIDKLVLRDAETDADGNPDSADAELLRSAAALLKKMTAEMPKGAPNERIAWANDWLLKKAST